MVDKPILCRLHVNRAEMRKGAKGYPWTIHTSKECIRAKAVVIEKPCETEYRPELRANPRVFITLRARILNLGGGRFKLY